MILFLSSDWFTHSSPKFWASLYPLLWTLYLIDCLPLFHLFLFLGFCFIWKIFLCLILLLSLCLVLLGSSPTSPSLVRVILCRRCLVDPNGTIPLSHQSQVLQGCPLCELSMLSCCSWAMITTGTPVDGAYPQAMDYVSHNMGRTTMWFPQGNHRGYDIPPICESPHWGCGSCPDHICAPPTQHSVSSSLYPWM